MGEIFGLFGVSDSLVARRMTLREYRLRWRGYLLAFLDREYFAHLEAFASYQVQAQTEQGKPLYPSLSDFYDRDKRRREVLGYAAAPSKNRRLAQIARNVRAYRERKEEYDGELFS